MPLPIATGLTMWVGRGRASKERVWVFPISNQSVWFLTSQGGPKSSPSPIPGWTAGVGAGAGVGPGGYLVMAAIEDGEVVARLRPGGPWACSSWPACVDRHRRCTSSFWLMSGWATHPRQQTPCQGLSVAWCRLTEPDRSCLRLSMHQGCVGATSCTPTTPRPQRATTSPSSIAAITR